MDTTIQNPIAKKHITKSTTIKQMDCKTCIYYNKFSANKTLNLRMINIVETFGLVVTSSFTKRKTLIT
jgi:hypothetical protein